MDSVFHALANAHRRTILDVIRATPGIAVGELAAKFDVSRITVMKHLDVLERAGLIVSEKVGARRRLFLNTVPLQEIHDRWTSTFTEMGARRVLDIKQRAEATSRLKRNKANDTGH
jgi:DNA-binding transcriptional ArsR family regulator